MALLPRLRRWWSETIAELKRELPVIIRAQRDLGALRDDNGMVITWTGAPGYPQDPE